MTAHPYIIQRRAGSFDTVFPNIDKGRLLFIAGVLDDCGRPHIAEMVRGWAAEHQMLADRLSGAVPIGAGEDDPEITASAIAFGGPLPVRSAAE